MVAVWKNVRNLAMLFGLSFFIMNDNQQQKGKSFSGRFVWRMCLLLLFGLINTAFYDGDILVTYAILGMLLIPCSYLPTKVVWCIVGFLAIQFVEVYSCLQVGRLMLTIFGLFKVIGKFVFFDIIDYLLDLCE